MTTHQRDEGVIKDYGDLVNRVGALENSFRTLEASNQQILEQLKQITTHINNLQREREVESFEESDEEEEIQEYHPVQEPKDNFLQHSYMVARSLQIQPTPEPGLEQRRNIFHYRGRVGEKSCLVIIDGGSSTNCVSMDYCKKNKIITDPHPNPHQIKWLDNKEGIHVTRQAKVLLNFGSFIDTVICDVVPMDACHVLLGRPWEFDRDAIKYGTTNKYDIKTEAGIRYILKPLSPMEIMKSQAKMQKEKQMSESQSLKPNHGN